MVESQINQGDILKISGIKFPILVVSKSVYNKTNHIIACPLSDTDTGSVFSLSVDCSYYKGFAYVDNIKRLDLSERSYHSMGNLPLSQLIVILNVIQSIFDYI